LSRSASTDNVAVSRYTISRGGTPIASVAGTVTSFTDVALAGSTAYTYTITATDAAGNSSTPSSGAQATTPAAVPPSDTAKPSIPTGLTATAAVDEIDLDPIASCQASSPQLGSKSWPFRQTPQTRLSAFRMQWPIAFIGLLPAARLRA
jgi:chitodextrinase